MQRDVYLRLLAGIDFEGGPGTAFVPDLNLVFSAGYRWDVILASLVGDGIERRINHHDIGPHIGMDAAHDDRQARLRENLGPLGALGIVPEVKLCAVELGEDVVKDHVVVREIHASSDRDDADMRNEGPVTLVHNCFWKCLRPRLTCNPDDRLTGWLTVRQRYLP